MTSPTLDPDLDGFLALLATRRAPRTVDAYRRDLAQLAAWRQGPVGETTTEELERWLAEMRAAGLAATTVARRVAALRSFFRHQMLLGARDDNPAAALAAAPARAHAAAHALARRGRAPDRRRQRHDAARDARPGARRADVRRGAPRQRGDRPPPPLGRPRGPARPRARQGLEGAPRPARTARDRRAAPLHRDGPPPPRLPQPSRALPERARRAAHPCGRLPDPAPPRREGRARAAARRTRTCSGTRSRRICSRAAPTCAASRRCSATPICRPRSSTRTYPIDGVAELYFRAHPHARRRTTSSQRTSPDDGG